MWVWDGYRWRFFSLSGPWFPLLDAPPELPTRPPKPVIHEGPVAPDEYIALILSERD